jgi:hypothetical protein
VCVREGREGEWGGNGNKVMWVCMCGGGVGGEEEAGAQVTHRMTRMEFVGRGGGRQAGVSCHRSPAAPHGSQSNLGGSTRHGTGLHRSWLQPLEWVMTTPLAKSQTNSYPLLLTRLTQRSRLPTHQLLIQPCHCCC